jgi:hypothetical protein
MGREAKSAGLVAKDVARTPARREGGNGLQSLKGHLHVGGHGREKGGKLGRGRGVYVAINR